ncbi:MAG TPA: hypothetical protein VM695_15180 [Phycisphaerae bacterium]|nr:hypothetical protein [Phycisphaerae bacterium]
MTSELKTEEKSFIDAVLAIQDRHRERFERRRTYEWRISLALWSALGVLIGVVLTGKIQSASGCWRVLGIVLATVGVALVLVGYVFGHLKYTIKRHWKDRDMAMMFLNRAWFLVHASDGGAEQEQGDPEQAGGTPTEDKALSGKYPVLPPGDSRFAKESSFLCLLRGKGNKDQNGNGWWKDWGAVTQITITLGLVLLLLAAVCLGSSQGKRLPQRTTWRASVLGVEIIRTNK